MDKTSPIMNLCSPNLYPDGLTDTMPDQSWSTENIKHLLEERILDGHYYSGKKLNERDLAAEFNVSRTPIRDVIRMLTSEGLVEHKSRRGAFVKKNTLRDVLDMFEMLALLESASARLAARQGTDEDSMLLVDTARRTAIAAQEVSATPYTEANSEFHELIYRMAHNDALKTSVKVIRRKITPYREHIYRVAGMRVRSASEHLDIAKAIAVKDESTAADLMFHHLDMQRSDFSGFVFTLSKTLT